MFTRSTFDHELATLNDDVVAMADLVGRAVRQAVRALALRQPDLAHEVLSGDDRINHLWAKIERQTLEVIATQQPMATDLRVILGAVAISTDLERMGDHAKGIAGIALKVMHDGRMNMPVLIQQMADLVCALLAGQVEAYINTDATAARAVALRDGELDTLYEQVYRQLIEGMTRDPETIPSGERLLWVAKSLERMGDHITNIGERIVFIRTGEIIELNG